MTSAVFFDRDDTLIRDVPYLGDPAQVRLMPHAGTMLEQLSNDFFLFVITNQSGVGRGYITKSQVHAVNQEMIRQLGRDYFTAIYCCYDDPNQPQDHCRKPAPKMILHAARDFELDLQTSFFVGDKLTDIQAGRAAGCKTILMLHDPENPESATASRLADFTTTDLLAIPDLIFSHQ